MNPYGHQHPGQPPGFTPPGYGPPGHGPPGFGPPGPPEKKGMSGAAIALWVLIGLVVLAFGGCMVCMGFTRRAVKDGAEEFIEDAKKKGEERREKKANPIEVKLSKLASAYEKDADKAKKKYDEEYVSFDAHVAAIKSKSTTRVVLVLRPEKGDSDPSIDCEAFVRKVAGVEPGHTVSVVGRVTRFTPRVKLEDCEVQ